MSTGLRTALLIGLTTISAAACATTRAEAPVERPALDVPMPPPRVIVPLPQPRAQQQLPMLDPVQDIQTSGAPAPARPRPPQKEAPKVEPKPDETKPTDPADAPAPVPQLRIPEKGDPGAQAEQIRAMISRALATLSGIDYQKLQPPRQKAYDDAKLFAEQADEALTGKNLVLAKEYAEKAERLTKELTGR